MDLKFSFYDAAERNKAEQRLNDRKLSSNERAAIERQRSEELGVTKKTKDSKYAVPNKKVRTFNEWQELRRTDKHQYRLIYNHMVRDKDILGKWFYEEGITGDQALAAVAQEKLAAANQPEDTNNIFRGA